jgi:hypothetical protein
MKNPDGGIIAVDLYLEIVAPPVPRGLKEDKDHAGLVEKLRLRRERPQQSNIDLRL